jgi:hypothetical protein
MLQKIESIKQQTNDMARKMTESYTEMQESYLMKLTRFSYDISNQRDVIRSKQLLLMRKRQGRDQMIIDRDNRVNKTFFSILYI